MEAKEEKNRIGNTFSFHIEPFFVCLFKNFFDTFFFVPEYLINNYYYFKELRAVLHNTIDFEFLATCLFPSSFTLRKLANMA